MAGELEIMPAATERFGSTSMSGNYARLAEALGGYGERVTEPGEIVPAIKRAVKQVEDGRPALLEFITSQEHAFSKFR
jgi:thiamine pyrophosphate-dependent acetolactate synthase large subunit-like protein